MRRLYQNHYYVIHTYIVHSYDIDKTKIQDYTPKIPHNNVCIPERFNTNISHKLFDYMQYSLWIHKARTQIKKVILYSITGFISGIQKNGSDLV